MAKSHSSKGSTFLATFDKLGNLVGWVRSHGNFYQKNLIKLVVFFFFLLPCSFTPRRVLGKKAYFVLGISIRKWACVCSTSVYRIWRQTEMGWKYGAEKKKAERLRPQLQG